MRVLNATQAVSPAWHHTRWLLLGPRSAQVLLKIGFVAVFAQLVGFHTGYNIPFRDKLPKFPQHAGPLPHSWLIALSLGSLILGLVLLYLTSRMQFVLFEVVLRRDTTIAPMWRRYGAVAWRWAGLKLLLLLIAVVSTLPVVVPFLIHYTDRPELVQHSLAAKVGGSLLIVGGALLYLLVFGVLYVLLTDFAVPSMALEDTSIGATVKRIGRLLRAEPGAVLFYLLMRGILTFAGVLAAKLIVGFVSVVALVPLGGSGYLLWSSLHTASHPTQVAMVLGWGVLALAFAVVMIVAVLVVEGWIYSFLQAYALYFLGGRYPKVGEYLEPTTPQGVPSIQ